MLKENHILREDIFIACNLKKKVLYTEFILKNKFKKNPWN